MGWNRIRHQATRRDFLRGMGAAGLSSLFFAPTLASLQAQASGLTPRKRLVIVVEGNGFYGFRRWDRLGSTVEETALTDLATQLPQVRALEPWRHQLTALNGLANKQGNGLGAGHYARYYATTCMPYQGSSLPGGPSIDHVIASGLPDDRAFPVLRLGAAGAPGSPLGNVPSITAVARGTPALTQHDPRVAWLSLFGVASPDPEERLAFDERAYLLDALGDDALRIEAALSIEERWKMQQYLDTLANVAIQQDRLLQRVADIEAADPERPPADFTELDVGDFAALQIRNAAAALISNLTDVVILNIAAGTGYFDAFANWGFGGRHTMGHGSGATETQPGGPEGLMETTNTICTHLADLIRALEGVPEGDGTMWDHTALVYVNDNGEQHHAKYENCPAVVVGDLGGALPAGGRLLDYPNFQQSNSRGLNQLWNTLATAMGVPTSDFGAGGRVPLTGLLDELV